MDTTFMCELCCNKYKSQKTKDRHICKSKDTNIVCQFCSKSFTRLIYKNKHEATCQSKIPIVTDVQLNNYGYENLDYVTDEELVDMISKRGDGVIKMILLKHFNILHPENHNVIINGDDCIVYKNDIWKKIDREALVTDLYYDGINSIDVIYEEALDNNKTFQVKDRDIDFLKYDYEDGNTMEVNKEKINDFLSKNRIVNKINKSNRHILF